MIDSKTKLCAVIGNPIEHSLSPVIHNAAFKQLNLNYVYIAFCIQDVKNAINGIRALGIKGVSVTIPHKTTILKYVDEIDEIAKNIGSANTIINNNGKLKCYSSDGIGALKALSKVSLKDKKILILGSGGAARAIAFTIVMKEKISSLIILGIIEKEVKKLVTDISKISNKVKGHLLTPKSLKENIAINDILIQCSPIGMFPNTNASLIPKEFLRKNLVVFDIVYNPLETKLIKEAKECGCKVILGLDMFVYQAAFQFELWTNKKAPIQIMRKVVRKSL